MPEDHHKDWTNHLAPANKPAVSYAAKKNNWLYTPPYMSALEIIHALHAKELEVTESLYKIFIAKAKQEPEGAVKQLLRKEAARFFQAFL